MKLAMEQREIETTGIAYFRKDGKDIIVSEFRWAEYTGRTDDMYSDRDLSTGASTVIDLKILHEYNRIRPANVWWHSHSNFATFWSGTDLACVKKWIGQELLSIVTNNKGDILAKLDTAFLSGIETRKIFEGNMQTLPQGTLIGERLTNIARKEFLHLCPKRNSIDNSTSAKKLTFPLLSSEQVESVLKSHWH